MIGKILCGIVAAGAIALGSWSAEAQTTVPSINGICPSGSRPAGAGYCRSDSSAGFIEAERGICPSGTRPAGAGYCRTDGTTFVPSRNGLCPSGMVPAGAGYCRER